MEESELTSKCIKLYADVKEQEKSSALQRFSSQDQSFEGRVKEEVNDQLLSVQKSLQRIDDQGEEFFSVLEARQKGISGQAVEMRTSALVGSRSTVSTTSDLSS